VVLADDGRLATAGSSRTTEYDRTPPQDIAAEQSALGGMMLSKDAIADVVEVLRPNDFYRPAHQLVYEAVLDLYGRGEPADPVTVSAELVRSGQIARIGGAEYLHTLIQTVPTAANAGYYAQIVAERATLRRLVTAGTRIVQMGYDTAAGSGGIVGSVDDVVDRAQAEVYDVTERRTSDDYVHIETLLQGTMDEIDRISATGGIGTGIPTGFSRLDEITNGLHPGQMVTVAGRPGSGKALSLDTLLPTPTGWTTMGSVRVGQQLLGADGQPTTVLAVTEAMVGRPCYAVAFADGTVIVADAQHQWRIVTPRSHSDTPGESLGRRVAGVMTSAPSQPVRPPTEGHVQPRAAAAVMTLAARSARTRTAVAAGRRRCRPVRRTHAGEVMTTEQIVRTLRGPSAGVPSRQLISCAAPLSLPTAPLPLPPYTLGAWLGDRGSGAACVTTADAQLLDNIRADGLVVRRSWAPLRYRLRFPRPRAPERASDCCAEASPAHQHEHGTVHAALRSLGVLNDKHIPLAYLRASEEQRRALLAGLLDCAGGIDRHGHVSFSATQRRLAGDLRELVVSLGYRAALMATPRSGRRRESTTRYTVAFTPDDRVFRLHRRPGQQPARLGAQTHQIVDVRPVASVPVRCVQVDNADHMYLAGPAMVPTHNSTLALDFARSAAIKHRKPTVLFSLEMGRLEIMMRLFSAEAVVPLRNMRSGHMSDQDWTRMARRAGDLADAPLFIDDSPNLTMMEIRAKARRLRQRHDLQLIVIDYLQLMISGKRVESRQQEVSEFSRAIKLLAKELDLPVVALSQLNRGPEQRTDKRPMLADLRESGSIEQDSDLVLLVHREDMYERESPRAGEADIIVAKHRNGPTATVAVSFQGHYSRFADMPD
jgi:replicative DNA helicase